MTSEETETEIEITVVLASPDGYEPVRDAVRTLARQTAAARLELILIGPGDMRPDARDTGAFGRLRSVRADTITHFGAARALAAEAAGGPVVAFTEEHARPDPGWAEALIGAHRGPWAAVGPKMLNPDERDPRSVAMFLLDEAPYAHAREPTEVPRIAWNNSSYKREVLVAFGAELPDLLQAEGVLQERLLESGRRMLIEPAARIWHMQATKAAGMARMSFHGGRAFAGIRRGRLSPGEVAVHVARAPAVPLVRVVRALRMAPRDVRRRLVGARTLFWMLFCATVGAFGETLGYLSGPGGSVAGKSALEFGRADLQRGRRSSAPEASA